jgi:hypothetical protein
MLAQARSVDKIAANLRALRGATATRTEIDLGAFAEAEGLAMPSGNNRLPSRLRNWVFQKREALMSDYRNPNDPLRPDAPYDPALKVALAWLVFLVAVIIGFTVGIGHMPNRTNINRIADNKHLTEMQLAPNNPASRIYSPHTSIIPIENPNPPRPKP